MKNRDFSFITSFIDVHAAHFHSIGLILCDISLYLNDFLMTPDLHDTEYDSVHVIAFHVILFPINKYQIFTRPNETNKKSVHHRNIFKFFDEVIVHLIEAIFSRCI